MSACDSMLINCCKVKTVTGYDTTTHATGQQFFVGNQPWFALTMEALPVENKKGCGTNGAAAVESISAYQNLM